MKIPRNLDGEELVKRLKPLGYALTRQTGSHMRLTRSTSHGQHHVTIPNHSPLRVGTLNRILTDIAAELNMSRDELLDQIL